MDGRDQRSVRRWDDIPGVVYDVDGSRGTLDHGTAKPLPGLVERSSWERKLSHGNRRPEGVRRGVPMAGGHADEVKVAPLDESSEQLHR